MNSVTNSIILTSPRTADVRNIAAAFEALQNQTQHPDEVILVVESIGTLKEWAHKQAAQIVEFPVTVLTNRGAAGVAGCRNTGIDAALGQTLLFLDDEAAPGPDWVRTMMHTFADPDVAGVTGPVAPSWPIGLPQWFPQGFDWVFGCQGSDVAVAGKVAELNVRNMAFRADVFEIIEHFSEAAALESGEAASLPANLEVAQMCRLLAERAPGAQLRFEPAAAVRYRVHEDDLKPMTFLQRCYGEGRAKALQSGAVRVNQAAKGATKDRRAAKESMGQRFAKSVGAAAVEMGAAAERRRGDHGAVAGLSLA